MIYGDALLGWRQQFVQVTTRRAVGLALLGGEHEIQSFFVPIQGDQRARLAQQRIHTVAVEAGCGLEVGQGVLCIPTLERHLSPQLRRSGPRRRAPPRG